MKSICKNIKVICYVLILSIPNVAYPQKTDSLLNILKTAKEDTNKVKLLYELCKNLYNSGNYSKVLLYANQTKELATTLDFKKGIANAYNIIGNTYTYQGNYPEALKNHLTALSIRREMGNKQSMAASYNNIGNVYYNQGNYPETIKNYFAALKIYEEIGYKQGIANSYIGIGQIYSQQGNYTEALKNDYAALRMYEEIGDKNGISNVHNNQGIVYFKQKKYPEALINYFACLKIKREFGDSAFVANSYNNIGDVYNKQGNYSEALKNFFASLRIKEEIGDKNGIETALVNIGATYKDLKNYKDAEAYCKKALTIAKEIGELEGIMGANKLLSYIYKVTSRHKQSLEAYEAYITASDSLLNEQSKIKSLQIANQFESEKKEKEIALLNLELLTKQKDQQLLNAEVKEKNSIITVIILGFLLLVITIFLLFNRKQLKQKNEHQAEINKQQENTAIAVIQAQENERNRIGQDLHDGMGSFLSTLKINLQSFEDSIPKEKITSYKNISALVDKTSSELRNIMKDISSETLQENGLEGALHELAENVNRSRAVHLNFMSHGLTKRLDSIIEINLYRVAQELINNCIKHSGATQATLQLIDHGNSVLLMMEDNGRGFDDQSLKQEKNSGMGLKNIRNRVRFIKGSLKLESVINKGSTFVIEIPKSLYQI